MIHVLTIHNVGSEFMERYGDYLAMHSQLRWRLTLVGNDVRVHSIPSAALSGTAYYLAVASLPPNNHYNFSYTPSYSVHPPNS